ncbi:MULTISPECIES: hypothetical protein [unclassified Streptomyces]|uniref:hypothetical protein n=1 Tax=unclassified Streptomyces TaxID=2593676 RepID=UPI0016612711|nr:MULTISPECIES: hypothetical protein [unclassified Streptomyces]MBD0708462.1 hypothetical protein [Streptomyces sp. CBMA291]MBD0717218.1 hypothetical protein [Streptomyces sp. CBMA370]
MAEQQDGGEREPQPIDEEAAWAAIVAGYGEEPADPPGAKPFRPVENLALPEPGEETAETDADPAPDARPGPDGGKGVVWKPRPAAGTPKEEEQEPDEEPGPERPALGSSVVFAPGVRPAAGPRDYSPAEPDGGDEGHFVPPEPPPLPDADVTTRFAWLAVVGGPILMLVAVLFQWEMTWWLTTLCIGGFLGGFATLVGRMKHDDEDDDGFGDPGRGAVV